MHREPTEFERWSGQMGELAADQETEMVRYYRAQERRQRAIIREMSRPRPGMRMVSVGQFLRAIGLRKLGTRVIIAGANRWFDDTERRRKAAAGIAPS
jgi:6-phosphogluconate dehydrogenase